MLYIYEIYFSMERFSYEIDQILTIMINLMHQCQKSKVFYESFLIIRSLCNVQIDILLGYLNVFYGYMRKD